MIVQSEIEDRLKAELSPTYLEVENESHQHSVPENSETHFRVVIASEQFDGRRSVAGRRRSSPSLIDQPRGGGELGSDRDSRFA